MIKLSVKNSSLNSSAPTSTAPPQPQTSQIPPKILSQPKRKSKIDGDETAPIEEHLILRLSPNSPMLSALKEQFKQNQTPDLKIKFKSDRACTITSGQFHHTATLVDLPCIIESSKTLDSKLFHKTGDICQMILVDEKNDLKDYVYPHGITPPMKFVRKRRFRKRISKRAIEDVEREIERLLKADLEAHDVKYEVHEQTEPEEVEEVVEEFDEEFIDEPADVEEATAEIVDADSTSEEEDSDENEEEEIIEQEDPLKLQMALVLDEVNDLEAKIHEKEEQVSTYANPIMKVNLINIETVGGYYPGFARRIGSKAVPT